MILSFFTLHNFFVELPCEKITLSPKKEKGVMLLSLAPIILVAAIPFSMQSRKPLELSPEDRELQRRYFLTFLEH